MSIVTIDVFASYRANAVRNSRTIDAHQRIRECEYEPVIAAHIHCAAFNTLTTCKIDIEECASTAMCHPGDDVH